MWRKHCSVYQDHMKYVRNGIVKLVKVKILCYSDHVREMHDLSKYLPPPPMKVDSAMADNCNFHHHKFTASEFLLAIKDGIPKSIQDELYDHAEDCAYLTYEYWCGLLSKN